ncbi:MAG TPA: hypothetical protein VFG47_17365 [Geminicoccaceae bacterium]|nr:hypothetical protein [Geminicoccaceae bacterium]
MRHLALILAAAAFTLVGGSAFAGDGCSWSSQVAQTKGKQVVASANGGATPVVVPQQPESGS